MQMLDEYREQWCGLVLLNVERTKPLELRIFEHPPKTVVDNNTRGISTLKYL